MTVLPPYSIATSTEPIIMCLRAFITDTLHGSLDAICSYDIVQKTEYSPDTLSGLGLLPSDIIAIADYSVRFGNGSYCYSGTMMQDIDGFWHVDDRVTIRETTYQEKCAYIASHAKPEPVTPEEVHEQITQALTHPLLDLFLTADDLADATIRAIQHKRP